MAFERARRYERAQDFFALDGDAVMPLTRAAAADACGQAAGRGVFIARIEGGRWHGPGFEPHLDGIWDGLDPPVDGPTAARNDARAAAFIRDADARHDVFILTLQPLAD